MESPVLTTVHELLKSEGFFSRGRRTWLRQKNDVTQIINFQKSNYSDEEYVNVGVWPACVPGLPSSIEYMYPLRGRWEDFIEEKANSNRDGLSQLIDILDRDFSSTEDLKRLHSEGRLESLLMSAELRAALNGAAASST
jgi:hypothetical protein